MSILIKGMEMPKNCWECHFGHGDSGACVVDFKQHGDWNEPKNCPLVHVQPHGRCIDADAIRADIDEKRPGRSYEDAWTLTVIDAAPTIIPAEEEDYDDTPICTKASLASRGIYKKAEEGE